MREPNDKLLLDYEGAARALSLSRAALRDLVYKGRGPATTKIGRRTFFALEDLRLWIAQLREAPPIDIERPVTRRRRGRPSAAAQAARDAALGR